MVEAVEVVGGVERHDRDALRRDPGFARRDRGGAALLRGASVDRREIRDPAHHATPFQTPRSPSSPRSVASVSSPAKRSEEHTSELQSLMRTSYAVFCLKKKHTIKKINTA